MGQIRPATKAARRDAIGKLLAREAIGSQGELREALAKMGIETTQATLSRDLVEMHATKVRSKGGAYIYALPEVLVSGEVALQANEGALQRWCQDLLVAAISVNNQVVLRTPAGAAQLLATAIDASLIDEIVGCVAGDDTLFVLCRSREDAEMITTRLLKFAESRG
ncbi:MAG: arginine repressor [Actinomycetaceae bacterium]|nr:arginine repressor [Actinomycetaceae bacterium]